jgi:hypothetical protein
MANCQTCKWSDETIRHVLLCFHKLHPLNRCSKKEHDCAEYENDTEESARLEW